MYQGAFVSGFVNISVYFTKLAKNIDSSRNLNWELVSHFFIFGPI